MKNCHDCGSWYEHEHPRFCRVCYESIARSAPVDPLQHLGLVRQMAKRFLRRPGQDVHELEEYHDGLLGLLKAVRLYDPLRGTKFCTVACWWIRSAIHRGKENMLPRGAKVYRSKLFGRHETVQLTDTILNNLFTNDPEPPWVQEEVDDALAHRAFADLDAREIAAVVLRHVEGCTQREIGERFGVTKQRIEQVLRVAKVKMRQAMGV